MSEENSRPKKEAEPLIVITTVASFSDKKRGINTRLRPIKVLRKNGRTHRVKEVRKWHDEPVGHGHKQVHVTLVTDDDRYLDIVFDTRKIGWYLVHEEAGMILD